MLQKLIEEFRAKKIDEYDTGKDNYNRHQIKIKGTNADFKDICGRYGLAPITMRNNGAVIGEYAKGDGYSVINYFALCDDICLSIANP